MRKNYSCTTDDKRSNFNLVNFLPTKLKINLINESDDGEHGVDENADHNETVAYESDLDDEEDMDKVKNKENTGAENTTQDFLPPTEAESFISMHVASSLDQKTPRVSQNENNFYLEQIENQFKSSHTKVRRFLLSTLIFLIKFY